MADFKEIIKRVFKSGGDNTIFYIVIVILLGIVGSQFFEAEEDKGRATQNAKVLKEQISEYETKLGQLVSTRKALEVTVEELKAEIYVKNDSIKEILNKYRTISTTTRVVTVIQIDTVEIPFETIVEGEFTRDWEVVDEWYEISGLATNKGLKINSLNMKNRQWLLVGEQGNFWDNEIVVSVVNSNPYISTTDMTTQVIKQRKKRFGIGVFAGVDYRGQLTGGAGVNYNLIEF